jgi:FtsH-binding integral membrane protein
MLSFLKLTVDSQAIQMAMFGAMSIFGVMFLFGAFLLLFGVSLGFAFSSWLFFALLLFLIVQIVIGFSGGYSMFHKAVAVTGLVLFSLYIVYDTNTILQRNYYGDFITASLDYYLDILNIFIDLLSYNQN